jgi:hypothetical protein
MPLSPPNLFRYQPAAPPRPLIQLIQIIAPMFLIYEHRNGLTALNRKIGEQRMPSRLRVSEDHRLTG